ncbi:hypothetical protein [Acidomonas methanolica]|uniref:Uncharacterized protein n=1 Tax=Acidomonas methanolica NBRC 104435 TaxID=1231351 RepID=A0A023D6G8_ACIMT|nr:hypothetical protein [Acidomonas methanolica]TCS24100.1 hypothetical protein EDC31_12521 [Acidomonas methanolica]GAJ29748.1 hypothetical protein Amme_076_041 [Acidomonas methanolica NBRC 104435]GBQ59383.1 hypothetical protein AA0498_2741 [Acidomonas methanolica]GEL00015.1 hypothetical protein AME01nite_25130 [Acidomonas methanolica NBRC 104435]
MSAFLDWARQPTTLQGAGLLVGALTGSWLGIGESVCGVMATMAVPLLIPEKSPLQNAASLAAGAAVAEIGKHALFAASSTQGGTTGPLASTTEKQS